MGEKRAGRFKLVCAILDHVRLHFLVLRSMHFRRRPLITNIDGFGKTTSSYGS